MAWRGPIVGEYYDGPAAACSRDVCAERSRSKATAVGVWTQPSQTVSKAKFVSSDFLDIGASRYVLHQRCLMEADALHGDAADRTPGRRHAAGANLSLSLCLALSRMLSLSLYLSLSRSLSCSLVLSFSLSLALSFSVSLSFVLSLGAHTVYWHLTRSWATPRHYAPALPGGETGPGRIGQSITEDVGLITWWGDLAASAADARVGSHPPAQGAIHPKPETRERKLENREPKPET